jgi:hypothetical protein
MVVPVMTGCPAVFIVNTPEPLKDIAYSMKKEYN